MKRVFAVAILVAAAAALTGSGVLDYVKATNCGGYEAGFFVWGGAQSGQPPTTATGGCGVPVSLGVVEEASNGGNQLAAFTKGMAPQLRPSVAWNNNATVAVQFTDPKPVKVKFWVLYTASDCDINCMRNWVSGFLTWANELLSEERAGIKLEAADGTAVVRDETQNSNPTVKDYQWVSETKDCKENKLSSLKAVLHEAGALNLYLVKQVGSSTSNGTICILPPPVRDMAFVARKAEYGTMLHEIGHLLGLQHSDYVAELGPTNVMYSYSSNRKYLTEGQVFWMHFADRSALPVLPGGAGALKRNCDSAVKPDKPCPHWKESIWQEQ